MPSVTESGGQQSEIRAALDAGIERLSQRQQVAFQRYMRFPLASDGSVFWVATGEKMIATGSLHYATDRRQDEDETIATNQMIFSSEAEVSQLNALSPLSMWIGSWDIPDAAPLRVAFAERGNFFREADLWHYSGFAVYPAMQTQILETAADLPAGPIVSNSLPIWLAQTSFAGRTVVVYPSYLVPENIVPPYIAAHIVPEGTRSLAAAPTIGPWPGVPVPDSGASPLNQLIAEQLTRDEVTLTLYGFDNQEAWQYLVALIEGSVDGSVPIGFADSPTIQDDKRPQREIAAIAQKKTIHISANYLQSAADAVARRLILSAMISQFSFLGGVPVSGAGIATQRKQIAVGEGSVFE